MRKTNTYRSLFRSSEPDHQASFKERLPPVVLLPLLRIHRRRLRRPLRKMLLLLRPRADPVLLEYGMSPPILPIASDVHVYREEGLLPRLHRFLVSCGFFLRSAGRQRIGRRCDGVGRALRGFAAQSDLVEEFGRDDVSGVGGGLNEGSGRFSGFDDEVVVVRMVVFERDFEACGCKVSREVVGMGGKD
jgi:hypothetical protein